MAGRIERRDDEVAVIRITVGRRVGIDLDFAGAPGGSAPLVTGSEIELPVIGQRGAEIIIEDEFIEAGGGGMSVGEAQK